MPDTIAAIATGVSVQAVGIIRVSGPEAILAVDRIFRPNGGIKMSAAQDRKLVLGTLLDAGGAVLDVCLCTISRGPNSYTGEHTAELHCHGSPVVLAEGLKALFATGVRQALPGEFTKRAFLNGRLDLSQAEAVIDLIEAETEAAAKNAAGQLGGSVGKIVDAVYDSLVDISAHFFAVIDYPDEDIEPFALESYLEVLRGAAAQLQRLLATFERGKILKNGVTTAIIGRPNVGKSSLLNALAGYDRAIVTPIAGTTRDTIEEKVCLGSTLLRFVDTAGIRDTQDDIELMGIARSKRAAEEASLVIAVFDGSVPLCAEDNDVMQLALSAQASIAVINKADKVQQADLTSVHALFDRVVPMSALTGEGLEVFTAEVQQLFAEGAVVPQGEILTNARQAEALTRALESIAAALIALENRVTPDAVLTELETAMGALGEITGRTIREDITGRIFERFCVGK